ncbi:MAG TPA: SIMPL domain-containing protein [Blastocatellia bacterium]|nr:SIMPL domain-containing protein [Blastocatellia bacterium]
MKKEFLSAAALVLLGNIVLAQEPADRMPPIPSVRVTGEATVMAKPDQAQIDIGVVTQAATAQAAASQNAQQLDAVLAELRSALGPSADIQTIGYSLNPVYRYPKEGGKPTITGYTASNIVQVKINDLTKVGQAIDAATRSGANTIHRLQFTLRDEQAAQSQALREAATKAKAQAEALAGALGLKISRVLSVTESGAVGRPPVPVAARAEAFDVATPVEPGMIEVHATVTLTAELSNR